VAGRCRGLLALCALVAGVAACGSSTPGTTVDPAPATAVAASPAVPPPDPPSLAAEGELVGGVQARDLCAFFGSNLPRLRDQSNVGTLARLAADVGDFYATLGLRPPDGPVIDQALTKACPAVRSATLVAVGQPDLRSL
jgi:hypothetical protein